MKTFNLLLSTATLSLALTFSHAVAQKRYLVKVTLRNGELLKGNFIRTTGDSLIISDITKHRRSITSSEIKSVQIHRRGSGSIGLGIGAGVGAVLGAAMGLITIPKEDPDLLIDFGPEVHMIEFVAIGAVTAGLLGLATGVAGKEFEIDGDPKAFSEFASRDNDTISSNRSGHK